MLSVNQFFEEIKYTKIIAPLVDIMAKNLEDFAADQVRFHKTVSLLKKELEESGTPSVDDVVNAIEQQIGAMVLFSYFLGLKANLDHFINPINRTFLDVDTETYLREDIAKQLPDCQNAQHVQDQFYATLTPEQQERYGDITAYICHMETVCPKLAHYYGYMLGNQLFPRIIPGYCADAQLTLRYRRMIEDYLGITLKHNENMQEIKL